MQSRTSVKAMIHGSWILLLVHVPLALAQSLVSNLPLECRIREDASVSTTGAARDNDVLIELALRDAVFVYPKDGTEKTGFTRWHLGYFMLGPQAGDSLSGTDSVTRSNTLTLRREPAGAISFEVIADLRDGKRAVAAGRCKTVKLEVSRFPFRDSPWPAKDYAEVRLYYYNPGDTIPLPIYKNGQFAPSIVKSIRLNDAQIGRLLAATTGEHPAHPVAACFKPRHAFVFLDAKAQPISFAEVCFECSNYELSNSARQRFDLRALANLVQEAGLPLR
jgi:hypothetical protein